MLLYLLEIDKFTYDASWSRPCKKEFMSLSSKLKPLIIIQNN